MRIVLLGPPGAGKGTQAKRLVDEFSMLHLSSGDILRAEKASGSELGKTLSQYMDAGQLVPDDVVVSVMAKAVSSPQASKGLLLDGFPRTVPQAEALDQQLQKLGSPLDLVVAIEVPEDPIVERITGRRSCPKCGAIYHLKYMPPKQAGVCDKCGFQGEFVHRDDDKEHVVRQRLEAYRKQTAPLLDYYQTRSDAAVLKFDGNRAPDAVTTDIVASLKQRQSAASGDCECGCCCGG